MLLKPMGIGQLIDRSFQLYRKHFVKLMLLMLILLGPVYLLQSLLLSGGQSESNSILSQIQEGTSFDDVLLNLDNVNTMGVWQGVIFFLIVVPLLVIILAPISVASIVHMVKSFLSGEAVPNVGELLRTSFRRLGPLAGSTTLVALIFFGIYMVIVIAMVAIVVIASLITAGASMLGGGGLGGGMTLSIFLILGGIVLLMGFIILMSYFVIRFGYYLPFVALGEETIGIGRSWTITRKSFWRIFLMYVVISIILYILIMVSTIVITFFATGIWSQLLQSMVSIVLMPLWIIPYALSFFDLRARNEGNELEQLIQSTIQENELLTSQE